MTKNNLVEKNKNIFTSKSVKKFSSTQKPQNHMLKFQYYRAFGFLEKM
jgi:hypothetical protein